MIRSGCGSVFTIMISVCFRMYVSADTGVMWLMPEMNDLEAMVELNTWISFANWMMSVGFTS